MLWNLYFWYVFTLRGRELVVNMYHTTDKTEVFHSWPIKYETNGFHMIYARIPSYKIRWFFSAKNSKIKGQFDNFSKPYKLDWKWVTSSHVKGSHLWSCPLDTLFSHKFYAVKKLSLRISFHINSLWYVFHHKWILRGIIPVKKAVWEGWSNYTYFFDLRQPFVLNQYFR